MNNKPYLQFLILFMGCLLCNAMSACADGLPPEMMIDGKPIDPMCFGEGLGGEPKSAFPLKGCGKGSIVNELIVQDDGRTQIADYVEEQPIGDYRSSGMYNAYTYAGMEKYGSLIVLFKSNTGGTGQFSSLVRLTRENDTMIIQDYLAGGDRCNGGIEDVQIDPAGAITYAQNVTPYDLFTLGHGGEDLKVVAFDDIDDCAICCYGVAMITNDAVRSVSLNPDLPNNFAQVYEEQQSGTPLKLQTCFDKMVSAKISAGQTDFSIEDWKVFTQDFEKKCLKSMEEK